jgi:hypothetical protein
MIKYYFSFLILILISSSVRAQLPDSIPAVSNTLEEQLENATANNSDNAPVDDYYLQLMQQYQEHHLNLNTADEDDLGSLKILTPLQIQNIISYRNLLGKFVDIYELQAVPTMDIQTIEKILPFITVSANVDIINSIGQRFKGGSSSILVRVIQTLEKSKGYLLDSSDATNFYPGSPQHLFVRYKYVYKNLMQYGVTGDKDAGEQFFKGAQKQGFDFYSAHFFVRNIGIIKALALGDFTVNMGQGLIQWQNLAFKKGPDVINIKRQSPVLVPYSSSGEVFFHRGLGITIGNHNNSLQATVFASYRHLDANFNVGDTLNTQDDYVSSLETSGYHRTASEVADKGVLHQTAIGGNVSLNKSNFHIGINEIQYHFNVPLIKAPDPYNLFALSGNAFGNSSIDYSYTFRNLHFFGEAATTNNFNNAFVNGLLISVDPTVDMSFLYRNISPAYQSLYTNAFTEASTPNNETGFYSGISIHPNAIWRIDAYADFNKGPWLKYQVNAPTTGADYLIQATFTPNKQLSLYTRYHAETKQYDNNPNNLPLSPVVPIPIKDWRTQISYKISSSVIFRTREELSWYQNASSPETGFLTYVDVLYSPRTKKYSGNVRLQYFETDSYNSRMYAYEEDVLYAYSIPVFYGEGYRYYLNLNYDVNKHLSFWCRWAQTIYNNQTTIGTGLDEINGNKKSEITLQGMYRF